ncbi:unnamed protein product [Nesidiocoris tenuis]|uniref:Reverse transcriptase RNase H-like domain-containing protein n=1 Tax=Nesidiocoris tenuis TaxID=355587 RepID=A0A6H5HIP4_9HEMI|nr:unnamed protein product [Nesidiocoris tenuis]
MVSNTSIKCVEHPEIIDCQTSFAPSDRVDAGLNRGTIRTCNKNFCQSACAVRYTPYAARFTPYAVRFTPSTLRCTQPALRRTPPALRRTPPALRRTPSALRRTPSAILLPPSTLRLPPSREKEDRPRPCPCRTEEQQTNAGNEIRNEHLPPVSAVSSFLTPDFDLSHPVYTPLQWLFSLKEPSSKLFRWRLKLEEYDYEIHYKKGTANANADALSRVEIQNNETNSPNSPNSPSIDYLTDPEQVRQILGWEQCSTPPIHVDPRTIISDPDEIQRVIGEKLENAGVENDTMSVIDELVNRRHDELVQDRSDQSLVVNLDESDRLTEDSSVAPTVHSNYEGNTTFAIPISDKPVNHSNHQIRHQYRS